MVVFIALMDGTYGIRPILRGGIPAASRTGLGQSGLDRVATCSYTVAMKTVSIREAKNRLTELAREVERGETILVTRNGSPVFELTPHRPRKGLRLGAIDEFKRKHGVEEIVAFIADGFDDPLPEDFLLRPLPSDA